MLIDSHCHLNMLDLKLHNNDLQTVLTKAQEQGVKHFICVSIDLEHFPELCEIKNNYPNVDISVGVHPNEADVPTPEVDTLIKLAKEHQVVAIGETGLDYHYIEGDKTWQQQRFRNHIHAAKELKLPIIIHTREARDDTINIMQEEGADRVGGVMHCFTETWDMAKKALDLNFYISFSGIVTFKNATQLKEVAKNVPLDRMLVETDCPYLAPVPFRGKANEPAYVRHVAEYIAELRNMPFEEIAAITTENAKTLFNLKIE